MSALPSIPPWSTYSERTHELIVGGSCLMVTRHAHFDESLWVMRMDGDVTCRPRALMARDIEGAKVEALERAKRWVEEVGKLWASIK